MKGIKKAIPWWLKIGIKIVLARLPIYYAFWKRIGMFEHGDMNQPQRALEIFIEHARTADVIIDEGSRPQFKTQDDNYTVLELGPGDSLFTAVIAKSLGASKIWLVDAGSYATTAMQPYADLIDYLRKQSLSAALNGPPQTLMDLLKVCRAEYLTEGVRSLTNMPSNSVDYCFSNAVLEHIPKGDFVLLVKELYRVMKPDGVSSHCVDGGNLGRGIVS
jgi:SAM-dependent methyltransferase